MSLRGLSAGNILGYSTTPRTVQQLKAQLSEQHATFITQQLKRANEVIISYENYHAFSVYYLILKRFHEMHQEKIMLVNNYLF